jgi:hypothetical protein
MSDRTNVEAGYKASRTKDVKYGPGEESRAAYEANRTKRNENRPETEREPRSACVWAAENYYVRDELERHARFDAWQRANRANPSEENPHRHRRTAAHGDHRLTAAAIQALQAKGKHALRNMLTD